MTDQKIKRLIDQIYEGDYFISNSTKMSSQNGTQDIELTATMAYTRKARIEQIRIFYSKSLNEKIIDKQCVIIKNQKQESGHQNSAQIVLQITHVEIVDYSSSGIRQVYTAHLRVCTVTS